MKENGGYGSRFDLTITNKFLQKNVTFSELLEGNPELLGGHQDVTNWVFQPPV